MSTKVKGHTKETFVLIVGLLLVPLMSVAWLIGIVIRFLVIAFIGGYTEHKEND